MLNMGDFITELPLSNPDKVVVGDAVFSDAAKAMAGAFVGAKLAGTVLPEKYKHTGTVLGAVVGAVLTSHFLRTKLF